MKKIKKIIIALLICVVVLSCLYLIVSVTISMKINDVVSDSYNNYGNYEKMNVKDISIDKKCYYDLCYRYPLEETSSIRTQEENNRSFPFTLWWGNTAKVNYTYSYKIYAEDGTLLSGSGTKSEPVPVTISLVFDNGMWKVTAVDEPF